MKSEKQKSKATATATAKKAEQSHAKPKRPLSAYNFYFQSERAKLLAESASGDAAPLAFGEIGREIGKRWKDVQGEDLDRYKAMAADDSARYKLEMDAYNEYEAEKVKGSGLREMKGAGENGPTLMAARFLPSSSSGTQEQQSESSQASLFPSTNAAAAVRTEQPVDDQLLMMLLQHQQSASSAIPSETIVRLLLNQKASVIQQQQKLMGELNGLQMRADMLDKMLATEASKLLAGGASGTPGGPLPAIGNSGATMPSIAQQLAQLLQLQQSLNPTLSTLPTPGSNAQPQLSAASLAAAPSSTSSTASSMANNAPALDAFLRQFQEGQGQGKKSG